MTKKKASKTIKTIYLFKKKASKMRDLTTLYDAIENKKMTFCNKKYSNHKNPVIIMDFYVVRYLTYSLRVLIPNDTYRRC